MMMHRFGAMENTIRLCLWNDEKFLKDFSNTGCHALTRRRIINLKFYLRMEKK
jgi:hypothetical protein